MAKRFVKYETENPVGVDAEGVLVGGSGSGGGNGTKIAYLNHIQQFNTGEFEDYGPIEMLEDVKNGIIPMVYVKNLGYYLHLCKTTNDGEVPTLLHFSTVVYENNEVKVVHLSVNRDDYTFTTKKLTVTS